jgi:hypothetical protein
MDTTLIELAERTGDGLGIRLLWNRSTGAVVLEVTDDKTDTTFEVQVPGDRAMDAFRHPFVYVEPVEPLFDAAVV